MTRQYIKLVFFLIISTLLFSCATYQVQTTESLFNPYEFKADKYEPKVENFMIILDSSSSMSERYKGQSKFKIAKNFLSAMNQTIPNLKLTVHSELLDTMPVCLRCQQPFFTDWQNILVRDLKRA